MPQFVRRSNSKGRSVALLLLLAAAVGLGLAAVAASSVSKPSGVAQRPGYFLRSLRTSVETLIGSQTAALDGGRDVLRDKDLQQQGGNTSLAHSHAAPKLQAAAGGTPRQPSAAEKSSGAPRLGGATAGAPAGGAPSAAQQHPPSEGGSSGGSGSPVAQQQQQQQQELGPPAPTQVQQEASGTGRPAADGAGAAAEAGAAAPASAGLPLKQGQQASPAAGAAGEASGQPSSAAASHQEDTCVVSLKLRKVALLFLTVGELPHQQLWLEWLQQAEGLLPLRALLDPAAVCLRKCGGQGDCQLECGPQALCHPACQAQLRERYTIAASDSTPGGTSPVLRRQHLFSIYTHAPPSFAGYPRSSLFAGTLIERRVVTMWGTHTLMTAERRLLEAAARSPDNAWFVLVSETTVPLYPPQLLWAQLMAETRSKVNACEKPNSHEHRMSKYMETPTFKAEHWRKSSQWFMLTRRHTNMVLADRAIHLAFLRHCRTGYDRFVRQYRQCVSDEHLIPSLLASLGEADATSCDTWGGTFVEWSGGGSHPRTYWSGEISAGLIEAMRNTHFGGGCENHDVAMEAAARGFVSLGDLTGEQGVCSAALDGAEDRANEYSSTRLNEMCTLMGRKVAGEAAGAVLKLYRDCSAGLKVLPCLASNSTQQQEQQQQQQGQQRGQQQRGQQQQQRGQQQQQQAQQQRGKGQPQRQRQRRQQQGQNGRPLPRGVRSGQPAGSAAQ